MDGGQDGPSTSWTDLDDRPSKFLVSGRMWTDLDNGPSKFLKSGRRWTADRMDRPPHGRIWTTDHKKIRNVDGGGRVDGWTKVRPLRPGLKKICSVDNMRYIGSMRYLCYSFYRVGLAWRKARYCCMNRLERGFTFLTES